jgi:membrane fusion protein, multidrug efflux system
MRRSWIVLTAGLAACGRIDPSAKPEVGATAASASASAPASAPVEVVRVALRKLDTRAHLEGEMFPYEAVAVYARANGFVASVPVDRGTRVKKGQLLATLAAPELAAQRAEAEAKLPADKSTFDRLSAAAKTEGAVAHHDVELAQAALQADQARVQTLRTMEQYLTVSAPFDGVVTERNVHPGALVGPQAGTATPMFRVEQVDKLRLTVPVPENLVSVIDEGAVAKFSVRAWPGESFAGTTRRLSRSVESRTRAMMVELDVDNADGRLAPGMFADVEWPVRRSKPTFFVPPGAIVQSTEKTFVARIKDGVVEQVPVQRGSATADLVEVFGALADGDWIARRGSEELRSGAHVVVRLPPEGDGSGK